MLTALGRPPAQAGRCSSSSGRATATSRIGAWWPPSPSCSTRSRKVGSAQCRSSNTTTRGRSAASASSRRRVDQAASSIGAGSASSPISCPIRSATSAAVGLAPGRAGRPAWPWPSPAGPPARSRPPGGPPRPAARRCCRCHRAGSALTSRAGRPSSRPAASRTSRVLPTPAPPSTVTSVRPASPAARSYAHWNRRSSEARPTNGASRRRVRPAAPGRTASSR